MWPIHWLELYTICTRRTCATVAFVARHSLWWKLSHRTRWLCGLVIQDYWNRTMPASKFSSFTWPYIFEKSLQPIEMFGSPLFFVVNHGFRSSTTITWKQPVKISKRRCGHMRPHCGKYSPVAIYQLLKWLVSNPHPTQIIRLWIDFDRFFISVVRERARITSTTEATKLSRRHLQIDERRLLEWTARLATITPNADLQAHRNTYVSQSINQFEQILQCVLTFHNILKQVKNKAMAMIRRPLIRATATSPLSPEQR